jgi:hypothetical protein
MDEESQRFCQPMPVFPYHLHLNCVPARQLRKSITLSSAGSPALDKVMELEASLLFSCCFSSLDEVMNHFFYIQVLQLYGAPSIRDIRLCRAESGAKLSSGDVTGFHYPMICPDRDPCLNNSERRRCFW